MSSSRTVFPKNGSKLSLSLSLCAPSPSRGQFTTTAQPPKFTTGRSYQLIRYGMTPWAGGFQPPFKPDHIGYNKDPFSPPLPASTPRRPNWDSTFRFPSHTPPPPPPPSSGPKKTKVGICTFSATQSFFRRGGAGAVLIPWVLQRRGWGGGEGEHFDSQSSAMF